MTLLNKKHENESFDSKEIIDPLNFRNNKIEDNNQNFCAKQQNKLSEDNDYFKKDDYTAKQSAENNDINIYNRPLNTDYREINNNIIKDSFEVSLCLKDKLFEEFLVQKEDIEKGKYVPKFRDFQNIPKYEGLTKKYFNYVRNEWFREILYKDSFIEYRNEIMLKKSFSK